jgi:hypothetical protein
MGCVEEAALSREKAQKAQKWESASRTGNRRDVSVQAGPGWGLSRRRETFKSGSEEKEEVAMSLPYPAVQSRKG